jgi:hypothetical protein
MTKIFCGIFVFFLGLAYYMFVPEIVCTVDWVDSDSRPINGPFYECDGSFTTRHIGFLKYTQIGNDVYRISEVHGGVLPSRGLRPRAPKRFVLIKLDGPVDWDKLQDYFDGRYLSDGKVILNTDGKTVLSLTPALNIANLHPVPGSATGRTSDYATDGHWVILYDKPVKGADAPTFRQIFARELDGAQVESQTKMEFGRDQNSVYYADSKLKSADPNSFGLVSYNNCRNPPPGIQFNSDQVERGAGWVAVDRNRAWEVDFTGVTSLAVTDAQLHALQNDLQRANAASKNAAGKEFDESMCKR